MHTYSLRKNNITIDFLREPVRLVSGDAHQLMQIFLNLVRNAEQAIRETRDRGTLRIRCSNSSQAVSITFQDDGAGISAEVLPYIFDPFYTTKRPGRGRGLAGASARQSFANTAEILKRPWARRRRGFHGDLAHHEGAHFTRITRGYVLSAFHCHRNRIPTAQTERRDSAMQVATNHFINQCHQNACAARADGVANGHGAAVNIHFAGSRSSSRITPSACTENASFSS